MNELKDKSIEIVNFMVLMDNLVSFHYSIGPTVTFYPFTLTFMFPNKFQEVMSRVLHKKISTQSKST